MKKVSLVFTAIALVGLVWSALYFYNRRASQPAIAAVKELFQSWQDHEFLRLVELADNKGPELGFVDDMIKTPVRFRNLMVGPAHKEDKFWRVKVSVEVTDIPSILATIIMNDRMYARSHLEPLDMVMPPDEKAESFHGVEQEMLAICTDDGKCRVDLCRNGSNCPRSSNVFNYVMDAGSFARTEEDIMALALASLRGNSGMTSPRSVLWLKHAVDNLGLPQTAVADIASRAAQLFVDSPMGKIEVIEKTVNGHFKLRITVFSCYIESKFITLLYEL